MILNIKNNKFNTKNVSKFLKKIINTRIKKNTTFTILMILIILIILISIYILLKNKKTIEDITFVRPFVQVYDNNNNKVPIALVSHPLTRNGDAYREYKEAKDAGYYFLGISSYIDFPGKITEDGLNFIRGNLAIAYLSKGDRRGKGQAKRYFKYFLDYPKHFNSFLLFQIFIFELWSKEILENS